MNCEDIRQLLVEGQPLTGPAADHIKACAGCRNMIYALEELGSLPDREHVAQIARSIQKSLKPVRPLPSDRLMILIGLTYFFVFSIVVAVPIGLLGFHHLTPVQRLIYYAAITVGAVWFSILSVQEMVPGSKKRTRPALVIFGSPFLIAFVVFLLFHNFDTAHFVSQGIPCLRTGCICATISGLGAYFLLRKGWARSPLQQAMVVGVFAGLAGVAVLALHCPLQNTAHILVWHLGAMPVGGMGGFLAGVCRRYVSSD